MVRCCPSLVLSRDSNELSLLEVQSERKFENVCWSLSTLLAGQTSWWCNQLTAVIRPYVRLQVVWNTRGHLRPQVRARDRVMNVGHASNYPPRVEGRGPLGADAVLFGSGGCNRCESEGITRIKRPAVGHGTDNGKGEQGRRIGEGTEKGLPG